MRTFRKLFRKKGSYALTDFLTDYARFVKANIIMDVFNIALAFFNNDKIHGLKFKTHIAKLKNAKNVELFNKW